MKQKALIYLNGNYLMIPLKSLEAYKPGVFQGQGVFETMLAVGTKVFDVNLHLRRLKKSFRSAKISSHIIQKVVKANGFAMSRVRILAWRQKGQQHIMVMALKYTPDTKEVYKLCLVKTNRPANSKGANIKSLNYQMFENAYTKAKKARFDEALLVNQKGHIFEASRANVFWFKEGQCFTPPLSSGCLNGITRNKIIQLAKTLKRPIQEKNLTIKELKEAEGIFLTNSLIGVKLARFSSKTI